jgi:phospholipid transport system substrate-binding protein
MPLAHSLRNAVTPAAFAFALVLTSLLMSAPAAAATDEAAKAFVTDVSSRAIDIISDKSLSRADREAAFGKLLDETADMKKIAGFALGQYIRLPTQEQKAEYLKLVRDFVVKVYVTRLSDYHNEKLVITDAKAKGKTQAIVDSQINFTNGRQPVQVKWWLVKDDSGNYKIFDVNVVGIWLAQEQRSSFTSVIANHDGKFDALLTHLKQQINAAETQK